MASESIFTTMDPAFRLPQHYALRSERAKISGVRSLQLWQFLSFAGSGLSFCFFAARWRVRRLAAGTRRIPVGEAIQGAFEWVGIVKTKNLFNAPWTQTPCVAYLLHIEESRPQGDSGQWETVLTMTEGTTFRLEGDSKQAEVRIAELSQWRKRARRCKQFHIFTPVSRSVARILKAQHFTRKRGLFLYLYPMRVSEYVLQTGESVAIIASQNPEEACVADALVGNRFHSNPAEKPVSISNTVTALEIAGVSEKDLFSERSKSAVIFLILSLGLALLGLSPVFLSLFTKDK